MQDILNIIDNAWKWLINFYTICVGYGVNPLSIICIILFTSLLKKNLRFYIGKYRKAKTMITALILGILFSIFFLWLNNNLNLKLIILNSIINTIASGYSESINKMIKEIIEHKKESKK